MPLKLAARILAGENANEVIRLFKELHNYKDENRKTTHSVDDYNINVLSGIV